MTDFTAKVSQPSYGVAASLSNASRVALAGGTGPAGIPWSPFAPWAATTAYVSTVPASAVTYAGALWVCSTSHTSTSTFDPSKWTQLVSARGGPWKVLPNVSVSLTLDCSTYIAFKAPVVGDFLLNPPTGMNSGDQAHVLFIQDATGGRVMTADASITLPDGFALGTAPNSKTSVLIEALDDGTFNLTYSPQKSPNGSAAKRNIGTSVGDPGTGSLELLQVPNYFTGATLTLASSDLFKRHRIANGGSAMTVNLPDPGTASKTNGMWGTVSNKDGTGFAALNAPSGRTINGASSYSLEPIRTVRIGWDPTNYFNILDNDDIKVLATRSSTPPVLTCATPGDLAVTYATQVGRQHVYWEGGAKTVHTAVNLVGTPTFSTASGNVYVTGAAPYAADAALDQPVTLSRFLGVWPGSTGSMGAAVAAAGESRFRFNFSKSNADASTALMSNLSTGVQTKIYFAGPYQAQ